MRTILGQLEGCREMSGQVAIRPLARRYPTPDVQEPLSIPGPESACTRRHDIKGVAWPRQLMWIPRRTRRARHDAESSRRKPEPGVLAILARQRVGIVLDYEVAALPNALKGGLHTRSLGLGTSESREGPGKRGRSPAMAAPYDHHLRHPLESPADHPPSLSARRRDQPRGPRRPSAHADLVGFNALFAAMRGCARQALDGGDRVGRGRPVEHDFMVFVRSISLFSGLT
jgi:hypothetical protein